MRYLYVCFVLLFWGCGQQSDNNQSASDTFAIDITAVVEEGKKISGAAFQTLSSNLKRAMAEGDVEYALQFCNVEAMPLTDSLATEYGIELRRASHQPRNPQNRADSLEIASIQKYLDAINTDGELQPFTYAHKNTITYHAPIRIPNKLCLSCHGKPGTDIAESDLETIQELYPEDQAMGFSMGDLRGIWSIEFPKSYFDTLGTD